MAERRMFAKTIIDSDAFLDMPASTQLLYFHLNMRADDEGFINSPKRIVRMVGCSDDDLRLLIAKRFILPFESGVVVIKHWRIHNIIRMDRYHPTAYKEEKEQLVLKDNGAYTLATNWQPNDNQLTTKWQPTDNQMVGNLATESNISKSNISKSNITRRFAPPSVDEVRAYCAERNNNVDPDEFVDFYTAKGWKVGNQPMKDWKAAVRTWEKRREPKYSAKEMETEEQDLDELKRRLFGEEQEDGI